MLEYSKKENKEFEKEFGISRKISNDKLFFWILNCSLSFTFIIIVIIANQDYEKIQKNLSEQITKKYLQTLFSELKITPKIEPVDSIAIYSKISAGPDTTSDKEIGDTPAKINLQSTGAGELLTSEAKLPEALVAVKNPANVQGFVRPILDEKPKDVDFGELESLDIWETPIRREGKIHVESIDEIVRGSQIIKGWRNPDEITFAIQKKEPMIEYCFKREAKFYHDMNGYVVVRFIILHSGKVDPTSVKIIRSTLRNKKIEFCIKKRLQSWRGFEELDASNGSVVVTQKFIFN